MGEFTTASQLFLAAIDRAALFADAIHPAPGSAMRARPAGFVEGAICQAGVMTARPRPRETTMSDQTPSRPSPPERQASRAAPDLSWAYGPWLPEKDRAAWTLALPSLPPWWSWPGSPHGSPGRAQCRPETKRGKLLDRLCSSTCRDHQGFPSNGQGRVP